MDAEKDAELRIEKELWDKKKSQLENVKLFVEGEDGADRTFTKDDFEKPVIVFKDVKNSRYVFPIDIGARVTKIFIDSCENCTFIFDVVVITQHIEIAHCKNCNFTMQKPLATAQIDLSENCKIMYEAGAAFKEGDKIYSAGSTDITVSVVSHPDVVINYQELVSVMDDDGTPANERQFVTQLVDGKMTSEPVVRIGAAPSTRRELVSGDEHVTMDAQRQADLNKEKGNEAFGNREYAQAGIFYTMALGTQNSTWVVFITFILMAPSLLILFCHAFSETALDLADGSPNPLKAICYSNRAATFLKLGHPEKALADAKACVALDPINCKGWFRQGLALHAMEEYREAITILAKARDLEPKNKAINQALHFAEVKAHKQELKRNKALQ